MDSEEIYKQAILFRRWLHRHPEVSTQEFQTQAFVIDVLKEYKIPYKTYGTGIIATLGEGADCVALRADMDALRVQDAVQVVALVLHHPRVEAVGLARDAMAARVEGFVAQPRVARHDAAQP